MSYSQCKAKQLKQMMHFTKILSLCRLLFCCLHMFQWTINKRLQRESGCWVTNDLIVATFVRFTTNYQSICMRCNHGCGHVPLFSAFGMMVILSSSYWLHFFSYRFGANICEAIERLIFVNLLYCTYGWDVWMYCT